MNRSFFTYKSLGADYTVLQNELRLGTPTAVFGVSEAHKYFLASLSEFKTLYITSDSVSAGKAYSAISAISGKKCVLLPAKGLCLMEVQY